MDLTKGFPRSPHEKLGEFVWLARLIDKARAKLAGKLGEYSYNCPMDEKFFAFTGINADALLSAVKEGRNDNSMLAWVKERGKALTSAGIEEFNRALAETGPEPGKTYFNLIDAEEKRIGG